ncbi:MAG: polysaccharide biosynthesis protein [Halobacteriovoraceae bacterium]|jgi:FlaA1/EpsC-like NDP-sugar epimerase|nr:polysaccharide biosynthesis protein [Halobacteriovoraceae bacterium]MBT5095897.1 polysaccharide biosynthesis protein [Halobacteriovoraceae bacterium]
MLQNLQELRPWKKNLIAMSYDIVLSALAFYLSLALRFDSFQLEEVPRAILLISFITVPLIEFLTFYFMGLYKGIWRYTSTPDLLRLIKGASVAVVAAFVTLFLYNRLVGIPRSSFVINWALLIIFLGGGRFTYRLWVDNFGLKAIREGFEKVFIIGTGPSAVQLLREIRDHQSLGIGVTGFIDDNRDIRGKTIYNTPVLGQTSDLAFLAERYDITKIFIAMPSASSQDVRNIVNRVQGMHIEFKILPQLKDIIGGEVEISQLRTLNVEDLLGRESVILDDKPISKMIEDKVVMVTGAGGSIGSELCKQIARYSPKRLIFVDQSEFNTYELELDFNTKPNSFDIIPQVGDVRDKDRIDSLFKKFAPQVVFHAAAYKHVPIMESNPYEAVQTNIGGTSNVARAALENGIEEFVMVSTDKAVNPTNIMGATKRIAEILIQGFQKETSKTKFITVRFGNVLGSSGSVIPLFKRQIQQGGPITVTHPDITRYFMSIPEATQLILQAGSIGNGGEIFMLDMGTPVKIVELAKQMITIAGLTPDVDIAIQFTGLRPGEKLFEELLVMEESTLPTIHPKVRVNKGRDNHNDVIEKIETLISLTTTTALEDYKKIIGEILPEYMTPEEHQRMTEEKSGDRESIH